MFLTFDSYKSPVSALLMGSDAAAWSATELAHQRAWFLVELEELGPVEDLSLSGQRTVLLFEFQHIEQFIRLGPNSKVRLKSVHMATPGHVNGSGNWKMDQLRAVWQGREPREDFEIPVDVFETADGKKYLASFSELPIEELAADTLKFEFSD